MKIKKNKTNKCLRVGECSFYYLYILITGLLFLFKNSLLSLKELNINKEYNIFGINTILYNHGLIKLFIENLGYILFGCIFILISKKFKKEKKHENNDLNITEQKTNESENSKKTYPLIYNENNALKKCSVNLLIASGVFAIQLTVRSILMIIKAVMLDLWVFNIIFISIFLKKILKYKIYKHHIYIFVFNSVTNFILYIIASFVKNDSNQSDYTRIKDLYGNYIIIFIFYIVYLSLSCMSSFSQVMQKKVMDFEYKSYLTIVLIYGIIITIISFITLIIASFIDCNQNMVKNNLCPISYPEQKNKIAYLDNIFIFFDNLRDKYHENKKEFFLEIFLVYPLYSFAGFMKYLFETMIVYYLNPYYVLMSDTIFYGTKKIISLIVKPTELKVYLRLIGEIIASIANLFFLEILEINCCGLNFDTKMSIERRGKMESIHNILNDDENNNDYDTNNSDYQSGSETRSINNEELLKE